MGIFKQSLASVRYIEQFSQYFNFVRYIEQKCINRQNRSIWYVEIPHGNELFV